MAISLVLRGDHDLSTATLIAGLVLPLISYQDHLRYIAFASDRPSIACVVDFAWIVVFVALYVAFPTWHDWQAVAVLWGISGLLVVNSWHYRYTNTSRRTGRHRVACIDSDPRSLLRCRVRLRAGGRNVGAPCARAVRYPERPRCSSCAAVVG